MQDIIAIVNVKPYLIIVISYCLSPLHPTILQENATGTVTVAKGHQLHTWNQDIQETTELATKTSNQAFVPFNTSHGPPPGYLCKGKQKQKRRKLILPIVGKIAMPLLLSCSHPESQGHNFERTPALCDTLRSILLFMGQDGNSSKHVKGL